MFPGDHLGAPDPLPRGLARELEAAVPPPATEAMGKALADVKAAIASLEAADAAAREELAKAAQALPERLAPVVDQVVRAALADALPGAPGPATAARLDEAIAGAAPTGGGMTEALLARVVDDWRTGLAGALADSLVPHAGAIADLAARVDDLDGKLAGRIGDLDGKLAGRIGDLDGKLAGQVEELGGALGRRFDDQGGALFDLGRDMRSAGDRLAALEALMQAQGAAIADLSAKLDVLPAGAGPAAIPLPAGSPAFQEQVLAKAVEDRLRPAFKAELAAALGPVAADQKALAGKADSRAGAAEVAVRALRTHIKASVKAGRDQAEQLGVVARSVEGITGRLAFAVEALSGHAALLDRLRRRSRWMAILAVLNFVAAILVFAVVLADRYWYMLG